MLCYCENCHVVNEQDYCNTCGKKSLRSPDNSDFCFLVEINSMFGEMFKGVLEDESITCAAIPSGNGVRSQFALSLENLRLYVAYGNLDRAKELLDDILNNFNEAQSFDIKKNLDKLFVSQRAEKKIKKILKIHGDDSLTAYCSDRIMNADKIVSNGKISGCFKGGSYLLVYKGNELIIVNSATYEIISAKRI